MSGAEVHEPESERAHKNDKRARSKKATKKSEHTDMDRTSVNGEATQTDKEIESIRQRLAFLCHDLRTFSANEDAELRLNTSVHTHFLGPPYLTESQTDLVQSCPLSKLRLPNHNQAQSTPSAGETSPSSASDPDGDKTLSAFLDARMAALVAARKAKSENDFVLCTSHDLAPLLQEACGFSKQHFETRAFKDAYKRWTKEVKKANKKS